MSDKKSKHVKSLKDDVSAIISKEGSLCQRVENKVNITGSISSEDSRENMNTKGHKGIFVRHSFSEVMAETKTTSEEYYAEVSDKEGDPSNEISESIGKKLPSVILNPQNQLKKRKSFTHTNIPSKKCKRNTGYITVENQSEQLQPVSVERSSEEIERTPEKQSSPAAARQIKLCACMHTSNNQSDGSTVASITKSKKLAATLIFTKTTTQISRNQSIKIKKSQTTGLKLKTSKSISNSIDFQSTQVMESKMMPATSVAANIENVGESSAMIPVTSMAANIENVSKSSIARRVKRRRRALRFNNSSDFLAARLKKAKPKSKQGRKKKKEETKSSSYCNCKNPIKETCLLCDCHDCKVSEILKCINAKESDEMPSTSKRSYDTNSVDTDSYCKYDDSTNDINEDGDKQEAFISDC